MTSGSWKTLGANGETGPAAIKIFVAKHLPPAKEIEFELVPVPPPIAPGARSLDPVSGVATELLKTLAEVAVERAEEGTFELVRKGLVTAVCQHLVYDSTNHLPSPLGATSTPLLPRTCSALKSLRLEDLSAAAKNLGKPLTADLAALGKEELDRVLKKAVVRAFGLDEKLDEVLVSDMTQWLGDLLTESTVLTLELIEHDQPPDRLGLLVLQRLAEAPFQGLCKDGSGTEKNGPYSYRCKWAVGLELALRMLSVCAAQEGGCKPKDIADMFLKPETFLQTDGLSKALTHQIGRVRKDWPELQSLVMTGLEVIQPRQDATAASTAATVVELASAFIEKRACARDVLYLELAATQGETEDALAERQAKDRYTAARPCELLRSSRKLVTAILREDPSAALIAGTQLLQLAIQPALDAEVDADMKRAINLLMNVSGTITAYAATYTHETNGDPEKEKQLHESRRKAIEGFIDAYTDRSTRGGHWVTSLGSLVGFGMGLQSPVSGSPGVEKMVVPQLMLPVGVAIQRLPDDNEAARLRFTGFHAQVSIIDLGQFVGTDGREEVFEPTWANFATISASVGFLFGLPSSAVFVGTDIRYSPALNASSDDVTMADGALRWSVFYASYYVPFFDFN